MRAYFENFKTEGHASNINFYIALEAFLFMGFHVIHIDEPAQVPVDDKECVAIGSINFIHKTLQHLGKAFPTELDYPAVLQPFLGRKIWSSTINEIDANDTKWNVFVKPRGFSKKFTGRPIHQLSDFRGTGDQGFNTPVWVSEIVHFTREWRVFVRYGKILDIRPYKGDWRGQYDVSVIEAAITAFTNAPNGYAIDFGVTKDGRTLLVEVNDGYSVGAYGVFFTDYAKLLSARWAQLTEQNDLCSFDL